MIWKYGLRNAIEDPSCFSPVNYFSQDPTAVCNNEDHTSNVERQVAAIMQSSVAVNTFWCSSRKTATCKDGKGKNSETVKLKSNPAAEQRSFKPIAEASLWRRLLCAVETATKTSETGPGQVDLIRKVVTRRLKCKTKVGPDLSGHSAHSLSQSKVVSKVSPSSNQERTEELQPSKEHTAEHQRPGLPWPLVSWSMASMPSTNNFTNAPWLHACV